MAEIVVPREEFARHEVTITPDQADLVTFTGRRYSIEVLNLSSDAGGLLYFTVDGTPPVVAGGRAYPVMPNSSYAVDDLKMAKPGVTEVRLVSELPVTYSVIASPLG